jgi:hypothetical protein
VRDGRLHHDGQRIGFPDIDPELVISSRGSIGIDETLDLHLELPRLRKAKRDKGPVQCHVTGTIPEPKISIQNAPLVVRCGMARRIMRVYAWACRTCFLTGSLRRATRWGSIGFQRVASLPVVLRPRSAVARISAFCQGLRSGEILKDPPRLATVPRLQPRHPEKIS